MAADDEKRLRGFTLDELNNELLSAAEESSTAGAALREWHRRFATPLTTLLFGVLAAPLFLTRSHFSRSGGIVLGVFTHSAR